MFSRFQRFVYFCLVGDPNLGLMVSLTLKIRPQSPPNMSPTAFTTSDWDIILHTSTDPGVKRDFSDHGLILYLQIDF